MYRPKFYILCGFLGSGKTTYARSLVQKEGVIHMNPDDICMDIFSKDEYEKDWDKCFDVSIQRLWKEVEDLSGSGKGIVFDMGFWTRESREYAYKKAKSFGYDPIIIYLYAPDNILKDRISKRNGNVAKSNLKNFDKLKESFEEPKEPEIFTKIKNY